MNIKKPLDNYDEAEKMIDEFVEKFYDRFGIWPLIRFNSKSFFIPKLKLDDLSTLINDVFSYNHPEEYHEKGLLEKTRKQTTVLYRHIFYRIAREIGYTFHDIGKYTGFNHATIINGVNRINDFLNIKDEQVCKNYKIIKNEIENRYGNVRFVQHDSQGKPDAKSILLPVLQEGEHKPI